MRGKIVAGVAFSSLLSVIAVVVLGLNSEDIPRSAVLWVMYVVACGLAIDVPPRTAFSRVLLYSLVPSAAFLLASTTLWILAELGASTFDISGDHESATLKLAVFNLLAFVTVFGIAAGIYARSVLIKYIADLRGVPLEELKDLEAKISTIGSIVAAILLIAFSVLGGRTETGKLRENSLTAPIDRLENENINLSCERVIDLSKHLAAVYRYGHKLSLPLRASESGFEIAKTGLAIDRRLMHQATSRLDELDKQQYVACLQLESSRGATRKSLAVQFDSIRTKLFYFVEYIKVAHNDNDIKFALRTLSYEPPRFESDLFAGHE